MDWTELILALYLVVLGALSLQGVHRAWLIAHWWRDPGVVEPPPPAEWPVVTVQVPLFNERYVVQRVVEAAGALDYPPDRLEIQVLDDSTDATTGIAEVAVASLGECGIDAKLLHREDREGFKAGALEAGQAVARGELIAVFDADFVPQADFLRRLVPHFADPRVGMVQARWGHLNAANSWLTRVQATLLDGHFVVEHAARHAAGRWFNFNGTAGIWRKQAILDGGGWQHDTVTEDLDLSYRAQLAGWRFVYRTDVVVPAELPANMAAFKVQQHRWARGSIQTARKLLGRIWRSRASLGHKIEATQHLGANLSYPLVVVLTLLMPAAVWGRIHGAATGLLVLDGILFVVAMAPFVAYYSAAIVGSEVDVGRRLRWLPVVLAVGLGLAASQSRAVWDGLRAMGGRFVRTPKSGESGEGSYRPIGRGLVGLELALAATIGAFALWVLAEGHYASLPFLVLFSGGYGLVAASSLRVRIAPSASAPTVGSQVAHQSQAGSDQLPVSGS